MGVFGSDGEELMLKAIFGLTAPFSITAGDIHVLGNSQYASTFTEATSTYKVAEKENFTSWAWDSSLDPNSNSETGGIKNSADLVLTATTAGTITHISIVDETADKLLVSSKLGSQHTLASGDTLTISNGSLKIEID